MTTEKELIAHLNLKQIDATNFQGTSFPVGSPNVFGGQVVAQALNAAYRTITNGRILNSLHSYFLEAGDLQKPINYAVAIIRDGGSFSLRQVTATQDGLIIFVLAASFQKSESGHEHQITMNPNIKKPEDLLSWTDILNQFGEYIPAKTRGFLEAPRAVEFKPEQIANPFEKKDLPPFTNLWFKLKEPAAQVDLAMKQQILAYVSDYNILGAVMNRHASTAHWGNTQTASLDHSMWFFREFDFADWLLYAMETPNASGARGFAKGNIFTRDGKLVACVAQEGLIRPL